MKQIILICIITLLAAVFCPAQKTVNPSEIFKIEADSGKGFFYPYYLYVPSALRDTEKRKLTKTILVIPNNTGKIDDSLEVHETDVKRRITQNAMLASKLGVAILMPVFPRPKTDWKIYTHSLDRDSMLTDKMEYRRFDLQLVAMIDNARERLEKENLKTDKRVLMTGFSASGMFVNRFAFLHPTRVKAAAIGSPGGWAIAPVAEYKEKSLRYPVGAGDFKTVAGEKLDLKNLRKVAFFMFLGDEDDNDSVVFGDGYETEDKDLVFELFGKTPVERWEISKTLYRESKLNADFKLYPNVKHTVTNEMIGDIMTFFGKFITEKREIKTEN